MPPVDQAIGMSKDSAAIGTEQPVPAKAMAPASQADGKTGLDASSFGALGSPGGSPGK
jgi:hypothetical protein